MSGTQPSYMLTPLEIRELMDLANARARKPQQPSATYESGTPVTSGSHFRPASTATKQSHAIQSKPNLNESPAIVASVAESKLESTTNNKLFRFNQQHTTPPPPNLPADKFSETVKQYEGWSVEEVSFGFETQIQPEAGSTERIESANAKTPVPAEPSQRTEWADQTRTSTIGFDLSRNRFANSAVIAKTQANQTEQPQLNRLRTVSILSRDGLHHPLSATEFQEPRWSDLSDRLLLRSLDYIRRLGTLASEIAASDGGRLLITAATRGSGTTTMAIALARWLATQGRHVLLVDADLGQPDISRSLGISSQFNWLRSLSTGSNLGQALVRFAASRICLLPLGNTNQSGPNAGHAFDRLGQLLKTLGPYFHNILIDVGPFGQLVQELYQAQSMTSRGIVVSRDGRNTPQLDQVKFRMNSLGFRQILVANLSRTAH